MNEQKTSASPVVVMSAPVVTDFGTYRMRPINEAEARALVARCGFVSAIGHTAAAEVASEILGIACPMCRVTYRQRTGERAIILRLNTRLDEGVVLRTAEEVRHRGYSLALLTRLR